jgi:oxaloacetate decarboxylase alpha subunit
MRLSVIKKLIKLVEESKISELEVGRFGTRVRISKNGSSVGGRAVTAADNPVPQKEVEGPARAREEGLVSVVAPMVGTLYMAPAPDAPPYVEVGDQVKKGQVLCIIEAMKLMNEIESEHEGRIVDILVKNEQPVGYGEELFLIKPAA